jgi:hypothetical protein
MDSTAVEQAKSRLLKAEKSLDAMKAAKSVGDAEEAWTDFLLASSTIYSKLEQGAKGCSKSVPWFGRKKNERRSDPLLRYLHFARNSAEHGIERVAATSPPNWSYDGRPLGFNERVPIKWQRTDDLTRQPIGEQMDGVLAGPTLKPIRCHDRRFNDFCDPPSTHLGNEIVYRDFINDLAQTALPYLRTRLRVVW